VTTTEFKFEDSGLGSLIWEASRNDEGTISATGASIVATAILESDWLKNHDAAIRLAVIEDARRALAVGVQTAYSYGD